MPPRDAMRFTAPLVPLQSGLGWVVVWLPFDPRTAWEKMVRRRICVEVGGQSFRTSLFSAPNQPGSFILISKPMQKAAGAVVGHPLAVTVYPDLEERKPAMPPELAKLLKSEKALTKWFATFSDSTRYQIGKWIEQAKGKESRQNRAEQMAERLMLTMEGEQTPPPILEQAFRQSPPRPQRLGGHDPNPAPQPPHGPLLLPKPGSPAKSPRQTHRRSPQTSRPSDRLTRDIHVTKDLLLLRNCYS